jgi:hypothetical protein
MPSHPTPGHTSQWVTKHSPVFCAKQVPSNLPTLGMPVLLFQMENEPLYCNPAGCQGKRVASFPYVLAFCCPAKR